MGFNSPVITNRSWSNARHARSNPSDVRGVVIHHMAGYFDAGTRQGHIGKYTAHYYIGGKQCHELIPTTQQGWHAANAYYNDKFVGIEHANISLEPGWTVSEETLVTSSKLMADLSKYYGWGRFVLGQNVVTHGGVSQLGTSCPGPWMKANLNRLIAMANARLDGTYRPHAPKPADTPKAPFTGKVAANPCLNIRKGTGLNAEVIGNYKDGEKVHIIEKNGDWGKTDRGYVHLGYVVPDTPPAPKGQAFRVRINVGLNVREEPTTNSRAKFTIWDNGVYTIVETRGEWGKLKSGAGWVFLGNGYTTRV